MTKMCRHALAASLTVVSIAIGGTAYAAKPVSFDGVWSLLVITESGNCDRAYRYPIRIENGKVRYDGDASIAVNGSISPNGLATASVQHGDQGARGSGQLSQNSGSGTWTGRSNTGGCAGRWEVERR